MSDTHTKPAHSDGVTRRCSACDRERGINFFAKIGDRLACYDDANCRRAARMGVKAADLTTTTTATADPNPTAAAPVLDVEAELQKTHACDLCGTAVKRLEMTLDLTTYRLHCRDGHACKFRRLKGAAPRKPAKAFDPCAGQRGYRL